MLIRPVAIMFSCALAALPAHLAAQAIPQGLLFTPIAPCRAVDTRVTGGPISAGTSQSFNPAGGECGIALPTKGAVAYAMNVTAVPHGPLGFLTVWPTGGTQPVVSTLNSQDGGVKANAAIVTGGNGGEVSVYATSATDLVLDVTGYFSEGGANTYIPVTPCRLLDTRGSGVPLLAGTVRNLQVGAGSGSPCLNIPNAPYTSQGPFAAVALNVTAVPAAGHPVGFVTVFGGEPDGDVVPAISTLNDGAGKIVANAAIVSMSGSNALNLYSTDDTDVVVDVTGYFTPESVTAGGLSLYPVSPCRVLDTRTGNGAFVNKLTVPFTKSACNLPGNAQAYVVNATVVPDPTLGYLSLYPNGTSLPTVSTLNAADGSLTSNMAIVSTHNGLIDAYASSKTQLLLDTAGYFAPLKDTSGLKVVFIGDDATQKAVAAVQSAHPNWINAGGPVGETTTSMLARFQKDVISKHPDVVVIMGGQYDIVTPGYGIGQYTACGVTNKLCENIQQMATMAYAAGIHNILESTISCGPGCQALIPPLGPNVNLDKSLVAEAFSAHNRVMVLGQGQGYPPWRLIESGDLIGGTIAILDTLNP